MSDLAGPDPYLDPASGILRNLLGITDAGELAQVEAALSASRLIDLERRRLPGSYDLDHLRTFHRHILGDVFGWAGELRTVSIAKGLFCLPQHLTTAAADVFGRLAPADRLRGLNREQSSARSRSSSPTLTHCTRSGRATDAPSGRSSPSSPTTPGTTSNGSAWTPTANAAASAAAHHGDLAPLTEMLGDLIDLPHPPGPLGPGGRRAA